MKVVSENGLPMDERKHDQIMRNLNAIPAHSAFGKKKLSHATDQTLETEARSEVILGQIQYFYDKSIERKQRRLE